MKKSILFLILAAMIFAGCNLSGYKRTKTGLYYKIIPSGGKPLKLGQYVKIQVNGFIHDSAFFDTRTAMAFYGQVDSVGRPHDFSEIIHLMGAGDSAVTIQFVDTLLKYPGLQLPPFFRKGDKIKSCLRIVKVFDSLPDAKRSYDDDLVIFREKEDAKNTANYEKSNKELAEFIAKNKINATQTPKGVYVEVKEAGTGLSADSGKLIGVKYTGMTLDGKVFDGNIDNGRKDTLQFVMNSGGMIAGFEEGIKGQKVGAKLRLYVPSKYGYGAQGNQGIPPFTNLIFDIILVDVRDVPRR